jgi:hypothetical protein
MAKKPDPKGKKPGPKRTPPPAPKKTKPEAPRVAGGGGGRDRKREALSSLLGDLRGGPIKKAGDGRKSSGEEE